MRQTSANGVEMLFIKMYFLKPSIRITIVIIFIEFVGKLQGETNEYYRKSDEIK
jgi:hypothetical protein